MAGEAGPTTQDEPIQKAPVSRSDLISLLSAEIEERRHEEASGGWTVWGLVATLAVVLANALNLWESGTLNLLIVAKWLVTIYLTLFVSLGWIFHLVRGQAPGLEPLRVRFLKQSERQNRGRQLVITVFYLTLWRAALYGSSGVPPSAQRSATFIFLAAAIASLIALLGSFSNLETKGSTAPPLWLWFVVVLVLFLPIVSAALYASYQYLVSIHAPLLGHRNGELRFAVLLEAAGTITYLLAGRLQRLPTYSNLAHIRRDLLLGRISEIEAHRKTEAELLGMDLVAKFEFNCTEAATQYAALLAGWLIHARELESFVQSAPRGWDHAQPGAMSARLQKFERQLRKARKRFARIEKRWTKKEKEFLSDAAVNPAIVSSVGLTLMQPLYDQVREARAGLAAAFDAADGVIGSMRDQIAVDRPGN